MERYNFKLVENKWQKFWDENKTFKSKIDKNKKNKDFNFVCNKKYNTINALIPFMNAEYGC